MLTNNKDIKTICNNIQELNDRTKLLDEQKQLSYEFLAQSVIESYPVNNITQKLISEYVELIDKYLDENNDSKIINFFQTLVNNSVVSSSFFDSSSFSLEVFSPSASAKISYVKNNYSDAAFMRFSSLFDNPKVSYKMTFEDVCEDVYNNASDFCILPIENSGGKLFSFYSLIDKYDMKIFAVCDLEDGVSDKLTRYALISKKNLFYPQKAKRFYIEFSIIGDNNYSLKDILEASELCGIKLYRIDTVSVPYDDLTFKFYHVFECNTFNALPFIIYLHYKQPQHEAIGYYISL